jgi:hypothetical protein
MRVKREMAFPANPCAVPETPVFAFAQTGATGLQRLFLTALVLFVFTFVFK